MAWLLLAGVTAHGQTATSSPHASEQAQSQPQSQTGTTPAAQPLPAAPLSASISGTVTDTDNDIIPGATVTLLGPDGQKTATSNEEGGFAFNNLKPGGPYQLKVGCNDCIAWSSKAITLASGQFLLENDIHLTLSGGTVSVVVRPKSQLQIATEQVHEEEHQRVLGVIPNFYVTYDKNPAPLSAGLKYKLGLKALTDPVTFAGAFFIAGVDQAVGTPDYGGGIGGYSKRFGSAYTTGFVDVMVGDAMLPALLHQDPRYFYKGTGTKKARLMHAINSAFITRGDNGKTEFNYSEVGGDLTAAGLANLYYPQNDRTAENSLLNFGESMAGHMAGNIVEEFFLKKLTRLSHHK